MYATFAPHSFFVSHGSDSFVTHCFFIAFFLRISFSQPLASHDMRYVITGKKNYQNNNISHTHTHTFEPTYLFAPSCIMQVSMYVLSISCLRVRARERECLMFVRHIIRVYYKYARVVIRTS